MFKFFVVLAIFGGIVYYTMRKRNIYISLSPSGQDALLGTARRIWLLMLRKIGLA
ncbi:hypothetical protein SIID45300_01498 [Candidatus Magnetaquicoccaceae bacterium FCR-1]|uniref:Uncharacterized protein n=1 Tax=Candidatus Magnetaquiglobus chichijimensis TaxID=3141448 RepID=A0ABQ0C8G0_9PROT